MKIDEYLKKHLAFFIEFFNKDYEFKEYHINIADVLTKFATNEDFKKLIVTLPPQHGKTELTSIWLPLYYAFINKDKNKQIIIVTYNYTIANRIANRIINAITKLNMYNLVNSISKSIIKFCESEIRVIGRGMALTGFDVDLMIVDDLYKDYLEANSSVIRESIKNWFFSVALSRLTNTSKILITMTRWHFDDIISEIINNSEFVNLTSKKQLKDPVNIWYMLKYPALSTIESIENEFDTRKEEDTPLWPEKHSLSKLLDIREKHREIFDSLYQCNPHPMEGLLYPQGFKVYNKLEETMILARKAYIDPADTGLDYFCGICYAVCTDGFIYILDILYTQAPYEVTEELIKEMLLKNRISEVDIEANSSGRLFALNLSRALSGKVVINTFFQTASKESRILVNAGYVTRYILLPVGWDFKYKRFYEDIINFKKIIKANKHDDAADALTGVWEFGSQVFKITSPFIYKSIKDMFEFK